MTTKIYTAKHCAPCQRVEELLKDKGNNIDGEEIKFVDVESDEGFEEFRKDILSQGDGAVPTAYKDGAKCLITIENEEVHLICDQDDQPSDQPHLDPHAKKPASDTA